MANTGKSKRRRKIIILAVIVVGLAALGALAFFRKKDAQITVQTEKIGRRDLTELVIATGKIQPVTQVVINPEVSGEIVELPVKDGQSVKKGDLLLRIRPDNYNASRNSADATYKSSLANQNLAKANLVKAQLDFERNRQLFEAKLISDSQFLEAKTSLAVMEASYETSQHQVAQTKAALDRAIEELSKTTIVSPIDGTVTKLKSNRGERVVGTAMMAGTEIMTIADLDVMEARVDVGEIDVVLIEPGQQVRVEIDSYRDRKFNGLVTEIANAAKISAQGGQQEATRFEVKIRITEKESFRPGMSVATEIETRSRTNALAVPIQCVTTRASKPKDDGKKAGADKASTNSTSKAEKESASTNTTGKAEKAETEKKAAANDSDKKDKASKPDEVVFLVHDGHAKQVKVKRGIADDRYVEILEGLEEGQEVVTGGYKTINRELEDDKLVRVDNTVKPSLGEDKDKDKDKKSEK